MFSISKLFEDVRSFQYQHKALTYLLHLILNLIMLGGFYILIKYGGEDDRYFWLGILLVLVPGLAMLPTFLRPK